MPDGSLTGSRRPLSMLRHMLDNEASGGLVLMGAAALALVLANSPLRRPISAPCTPISARSPSSTGSTTG